MEPMLAAVGVLPGLAIGSFLNVVAARVPEKRSVVKPRSACGSCGTTLAWHDNIPLVSYAVLRGKCRSCGTRIGVIYPAVELTAAALIAASLLKFGPTLHALVAAFFCATLVTVSATDVLRRVIPNRIVLPAAAVVLVGMTIVDPSPQWAIAAAAASGFLLLAALAYPAGMGMGDVKLALLIGAGLGRSTPVGADDRDALRARTLGRPVRAARTRRTQDGHSVRAVSRLRCGRRPVRRAGDPALVAVVRAVGA